MNLIGSTTFSIFTHKTFPSIHTTFLFILFIYCKNGRLMTRVEESKVSYSFSLSLSSLDSTLERPPTSSLSTWNISNSTTMSVNLFQLVILSFLITLINADFPRDFWRPMGPIAQRRFKYALIRTLMGGKMMYDTYKPKKGILPIPIPIPIPLPLEWEQPYVLINQPID